MTIVCCRRLQTVLIAVMLVSLPASMLAIGNHSYLVHFAVADSLVPVVKISVQNAADKFVFDQLDLPEIENDYYAVGNNKKTFLRLLRVMRLPKQFRNLYASQRLFADMAAVSLNLRLYPFAMLCYQQATDSTDAEAQLTEMLLPAVDTLAIKNIDLKWSDSKPVNVPEIIQSFNDGKAPAACAVLLHIKQPVAGRRRTFKGVNIVGHMFVTLVKYNTDKTAVSRSFGFYPDKSNIFSATPLHPASKSVIKDDSFHQWDEVAGKFISYRRFNKILKLLNRYGGKQYHLNENNCTDFGLQAASIGGIDIANTKGHWPFGAGNTPAFTGQSILEGRVSNTDTGNKNGLFIYCRSAGLYQGNEK